MTIQEMKNLKLGDVVQDLELLKNLNKEINCLVVKDENRYPHGFSFNEIDSAKLSKPIKNINELIYNKIFNNFRSLENFVKKDF